MIVFLLKVIQAATWEVSFAVISGSKDGRGGAHWNTFQFCDHSSKLVFDVICLPAASKGLWADTGPWLTRDFSSSNVENNKNYIALKFCFWADPLLTCYLFSGGRKQRTQPEEEVTLMVMLIVFPTVASLGWHYYYQFYYMDHFDGSLNIVIQ